MFELAVRRLQPSDAKEAGALSEGSGRPFRYVRTGREKEAEGPSARSGQSLNWVVTIPHILT